MRFVLLGLSALLIGASFCAQAKMFKWVDENGQMHFGDRIPEKYLVKEHDEINERGVTTRHRDAVKTPQQRAEQRRLENERKLAALEEKKKRQRDRVLLDTYTTESDLTAARKSRLDAVDTQIRLAKSIIGDSNNKIASLEKDVVEIKASNRQVPEDMYKRINSQRHQITMHSEVMQQHMKRRDDIATQFDDYIKRFRVLKAEQKERKEKLAKERAGIY